MDWQAHSYADCGQHAAGSSHYTVSSINPVTHLSSVESASHPLGLDHGNGLIGKNFRNAPMPPGTERVAFLYQYTDEHGTPQNGFHYAHVHPDGHLSHTDANRVDEPGNGGSFRTFNLHDDMALVSQSSVQPVKHLASHGAFVDYCQQTYPRQDWSLYYFCPPSD